MVAVPTVGKASDKDKPKILPLHCVRMKPDHRLFFGGSAGNQLCSQSGRNEAEAGKARNRPKDI